MFPAFERGLYGLLHLGGFASRMLPTEHGLVHALDARGGGTLPPIVLLHGLSANAAELAPLLRRLRPHVRRVLALDLPGHGRSAPMGTGQATADFFPAVHAALDRLIDEPAVLFGNSLGGLVAVRQALARPQSTAALVLSSPGGAGLGEDALRKFLAVFDLSTVDAAHAFLARLFERPPRPRWLAARYVMWRFGRPAVRALLAEATEKVLLRPEELAALRTPTLLLWGKRDRIQPPEQLAFFRRHLPAHVSIEEPDAFGHCPNLEHADALAARLLAFSARLAS